MTILEELIDTALGVCENGRASGQQHHARGAALLTAEGRVYTGCDVYMPDSLGAVGISADGVIFGDGTVYDGVNYMGSAYKLTPTAVPVPAAVWLFLSGLGVLGWTRRRSAA